MYSAIYTGLVCSSLLYELGMESKHDLVSAHLLSRLYASPKESQKPLMCASQIVVCITEIKRTNDLEDMERLRLL
jgi:hypothetical protein